MATLAKWAKYGVLAMIAADAVAILVVNHRLNQPAVNLPALANDAPIAMTDTSSALPRDVLPRDVLAANDAARNDQLNLNVSDTVARMDLQPLPAAARMDPLPAPMKIEPLALDTLDTPQASPRVARQMKAALRAPVIPTVRIAELRPTRKATRTFTTAFSNDISASPQLGSADVDVDFAKVREARDLSQQSAIAYGETGAGQQALPQVSMDAPTQLQDPVPSPEFGGSAEVQQPATDAPQATAGPETSAAPTGEIPAS